jgi:hypothetical protein
MKWRAPTRDEQRQRTALRGNLDMRRSLDGLTVDSLVQSFGVPKAVAEAELAEARRARA